MKKLPISILLLLVLVLQSCGSKKKMLYVQDLDEYDNTALVYTTSKIQPNDILRVDVSDLNPIVAAPFNIQSSSAVGGSTETTQPVGYLVNPKGQIMLPILNEMGVGGLTTSEAEMKIKQTLINEGYLINPTVQVRVMNNKFTILGEVNKPGVVSFTEQSIGLLTAIGLAGDLTYSGHRKDIQLIRETNGVRSIYHIDLTTASWMSDPDFRIRQNDIILVTPNTAKLNSGRIVTNPLQLITYITTFITLFFLIRKN
ncbi:polysaccharide biosynthesis/export family protein [Flavobacterium sp. 7A]|uniref:polysaccharide biosynthesis/export family protein n=1 Tax=Flavobacterium sp. 7A TaxID=2940571 RepID=UPI0022272AB5|nr:polysaccharide biosynthesis/export family protein [Flavobacterium sp. 7A]MCW2118507.1 polysaccharide export outer membrane protein [Flavobacterium sp. 7A]